MPRSVKGAGAMTCDRCASPTTHLTVVVVGKDQRMICEACVESHRRWWYNGESIGSLTLPEELPVTDYDHNGELVLDPEDRFRLWTE